MCNRIFCWKWSLWATWLIYLVGEWWHFVQTWFNYWQWRAGDIYSNLFGVQENQWEKYLKLTNESVKRFMLVSCHHRIILSAFDWVWSTIIIIFSMSFILFNIYHILESLFRKWCISLWCKHSDQYKEKVDISSLKIMYLKFKYEYDKFIRYIFKICT